MGGHATVMVIGDRDLADRAVEQIQRLEALWSRFVANSDTSRANRRAGIPTKVSPDTITLCSRARRAWQMTGGRYDPLLGVPLSELGYDRSFDTITRVQSAVEITPVPQPGSAELEIDIDAGLVTVPAGRAFDPGGIGKGLAGDLVVEQVLRAGGRGVLVDLGGDIRVGGEGPDSRGWPVGIDDPRTGTDVLFHVLLTDGAVASSSRRRRSWTAGGRSRHHLIDPSDGHPLDNGVLGVTVLAANGWEAEALTKAAFVAGAAAVDFLEDQRVDGIVVLDDGTCCWTSGLEASHR